jgi:uncharacterized membrane protein YjdF
MADTNNRSLVPKLMHYLGVFSQAEFKQLKLFIESPVFNSNATLIKLYDTIKPYFKNGNLSVWSKEGAYKKIFPGKSYNDGTMRDLMSSLCEVVKKMMVFNFRVSPDNNLMPDELCLLAVLHIIPSLEMEFEKHNEKYTAILDAEDSLDYDHYFRRTFLYTLQQHFYSHKLNAAVPLHNIHQNRLEAILLHFIILALDSYRCMLGSRYSFANTHNFDYFFKEEVEAFIDKQEEKFKQVAPAILLMYYLLKMHELEAEIYFDKGYNLLINNTTRLSVLDNYNACIDLSNFALEKHLQGYPDYGQKRFELYRKFISDEWYKAAGKLTPVNFRVVSAAACMAGEFEWAENFIRDYIHLLPNNQRDDTLQLVTAHLYLSKNEVKIAVEILRNLKSKPDIVYFLVNCELILGYLELIDIGENIEWESKSPSDELFNLIDTFRKAIKTTKVLSESRINAYELFVKCIKDLYILLTAERFYIDKYHDLRNVILSNKALINRYYFIQKLEMLKKIHSKHFIANTPTNL